MILLALSLWKAMISEHQTRKTEEQHDSSLSFIFKTFIQEEFKPHAAVLPQSWQDHWQGQKLVDKCGSVEKRRADVKESIILIDLASKAIISKFSELMSNGRKQTPALKKVKII